MTKKWVKISGSGQYRGEGDWYELTVSEDCREGYLNYTDEDVYVCQQPVWDYLTQTGYLPTKESEEKPE